VRITANNTVVIDTTTDGGLTITTVATLTLPTGTWGNNNLLTVEANADGTVDVWRTNGATDTYLGRATTGFTGAGAIGLWLDSGVRADNFSGGSL
jgi:hypothetical protein